MKMPPSVDDELKRFLVASITSVAHLEAALLFRRQPVPRTAAETSGYLYIPERTTSEVLLALCNAGVLTFDGASFHYRPKDQRLADLLDRLALAYASDLIWITNLIHDKTRRNAQRFSDAFKLRKDP